MAFGRPDEIIRVEWLLTAKDLASGDIAKAQKQVIADLKRVAKETDTLGRQRKAFAENERRAAKNAEAARLAELRQMQQTIARYRDLAVRSRNLSHAQREEYKTLREGIALGVQRAQQLERQRLATIRAESPLRRLADTERELAMRSKEVAATHKQVEQAVRARTKEEVKLGAAAEAQANKIRDLIRQQEKRIGMTVDETRVIRDLERNYRTLGGEMDLLNQRGEKTDNVMRRLSDRFSKLARAMDQSTREMIVFSRTMRIISVAGVIATLGGFAETLSALAGGAAAVVAGLAPLTASLAALPGLLAAVGQGMLVWKNATYGLDKAFKAGFLKNTEDFNKALEDLSVHARLFARVVRSELMPLFKQLRAEGQKELFPGLAQGIRGALTGRNRRTILSANQQTADIFGNTAAMAGNFLGFQQTAERLERIAANSTDAMRTLSRAVIPVIDALIRLADAAAPAVDYFAELGVRFATWLDNLIKAKSESGELVKFFLDMERTADVLINTIKNFFGAVTNILEAARPVGEKIFNDLDRTAQNFRKWTDSVKGQNALKKYFEDVQVPLYEVARIARDVFKFFISIGTLPGLSEQLEKTRTELGPALGEVFRNLTLSFGPKFTDLLISVARLLAELTKQTGPLTNLVSVLARMFDVIRKFVSSHPMVAKMAFYMGSFAASLRLFRFTAQMTGLTIMFRGLRNIFNVLSSIRSLGAAGMLGRIASAAGSAGLLGVGALGVRGGRNYTVGAGIDRGPRQGIGSRVAGMVKGGALPVAIVGIAAAAAGMLGSALGIPEQIASTMTNVGMGAAGGFMVAGPWGALVGAMAGLVLSFDRGKTAAERIADAFDLAKQAVDEHTQATKDENRLRMEAGEIGNRIRGVDLSLASMRESRTQFVATMREQGYSDREIRNMTAYKQLQYDINNLTRERKQLQRDLAAAIAAAEQAERDQAAAIDKAKDSARDLVRPLLENYKSLVAGKEAMDASGQDAYTLAERQKDLANFTEIASGRLQELADTFRREGKPQAAEYVEELIKVVDAAKDIDDLGTLEIKINTSGLDEALQKIKAIIRKIDELSRRELGFGMTAGARDALQGRLTGATGGFVPGARAMADNVPAMLSPGEFVLTNSGQQMVESMGGPGSMAFIASNQLPHFATGGFVGRPINPEGQTVGPGGGGGGGSSGGGGGGGGGTGRRRILSPAQIGRVAKKVGFTGRDLVEAIAVALAESGGNVFARALTSLEDSRGLWQINTYAHEWAKNLYNPGSNARAAYRISGGGKNWNPWTVWKTGAYKRFWKAAERGAKRSGGADAAGTGGASDVEYMRNFAPGELFAQTTESLLAGYQAGLGGQSFTSLLPGIISSISTDGGSGGIRGVGGRGSNQVRKAISFARSIGAMGLSYKWGGGHGGWDWDGPYDCSGFVSHVLRAGWGKPGAPVTTGSLLPGNFGLKAGRGKEMTVYTRNTSDPRQSHTFVSLLGKQFESGGVSGRGGGPTSRGTGGFTPSHFKGFRRGGAAGMAGFRRFAAGGSVPGLGSVTGGGGGASSTQFANQLISFGNYLSGLSYSMLVKLMNRLKRMVAQAARAAIAASGTRAAGRLRRQLEQLRAALDLVAAAVGNAIGKMVAAVQRAITNINNQLQYALNAISIAGGSSSGAEAQGLISGAITALAAEEQRLREALAMAEATGNQELIDDLTAQLWDVVFQIQGLQQTYVDNAQAAADEAAAAQEEAANAAMDAAQAAADAQQAAADAAVESWNKLQEQAAKLTDRISNQLAILEASFAIGGIADTPEAMRRKAAFLIERMLPAIVNQIRTAGGQIFGEVLALFSQLGISVPTNAPAAARGMRVPQGGRYVLVGEGGYDEYILTTDPRHRARQMSLLNEYIGRIGASGEGGVDAATLRELFKNRDFEGVREYFKNKMPEVSECMLEIIQAVQSGAWKENPKEFFKKLWQCFQGDRSRRKEFLEKQLTGGRTWPPRGFAEGGVVSPTSYNAAMGHVPRFATGGTAVAARIPEDPCKGTPQGTAVTRKKSSDECGGCGNMLAWGGWCWKKGDQGPFTKWLEFHGSGWAKFKKNNPGPAAFLAGTADTWSGGGATGGDTGGGTGGATGGAGVPSPGGVPDTSGVTGSSGGGGGGGGGVVDSGGGAERTEIDIAGLNAQLAQTLAEIAELLKQAVLGDAARFVEDASHATRMEQLSYEGLQTQQRLAGNFDDVASQITRRDFILNQIIPKLQDELNALVQQQTAAQQEGDKNLAQQIAEAIVGKQNEILQAQLDAQEQTAQNTSDTADALKELSGSLAFSFGGQSFTDLLGTGVGT